MQTTPRLFDTLIPTKPAGDPPYLYKVSLVNNPANGFRFSATAIGQAIILEGVVLAPNLPINRRDPTGEAYYIRFSKRVIQVVSAAFAAKPTFSIGHLVGMSTASLLQSWLTDQDHADIPVGSWMIRVSIPKEGPLVIAPTKDGQPQLCWVDDNNQLSALTGFSLEGLFTLRETKGVSVRRLMRPTTPQPRTAIQIKCNADDNQDDVNTMVSLGEPQGWTQIWQWLVQAVVGKAIEVAATAATKAIQNAFNDGKPVDEAPSAAPKEVKTESSLNPEADQDVPDHDIQFGDGPANAPQLTTEPVALTVAPTDNLPDAQTKAETKAETKAATKAQSEHEALTQSGPIPAQGVTKLTQVISQQADILAGLTAKIDQLEALVNLLSSNPVPLPNLDATLAAEARKKAPKADHAVADEMVSRLRRVKAAKKHLD